MITIFTPTYNRKEKLNSLYTSLLNQNYKDFEWLIVDDGSTDGTNNYIKELQKENKINIRYIYKKNEGKMSAVNIAHQEAFGDCFMTIDSDDELMPNILSVLVRDFKKIEKKEELAGIVYLASYKGNAKEIIGDKLPKNGTECPYTDLSLKYKIKGDKATLWKTSVLRNYMFPIIEGEKFIPDLYLMMMISRNYKIMTMNKSVMLVEYLDTGYSNNYFDLVKRNPLGTALYYKELYDFNPVLYNIYGYILFCIYGKKKIKNIIKEHPAKIKVIILYIPTWIVAKIRR